MWLGREKAARTDEGKIQAAPRFAEKPRLFIWLTWGRWSASVPLGRKKPGISTRRTAPRPVFGGKRPGHERPARVPRSAGQGEAQQGAGPQCARACRRGAAHRRDERRQPARRLGRTQPARPIELREGPHGLRAQPPVRLWPARTGEGAAGAPPYRRPAHGAAVRAHRLPQARRRHPRRLTDAHVRRRV